MTSAAHQANARRPLRRSGAHRTTFLGIVILCLMEASFAGAQPCATEAPPSVQLGELFRDVQMKGIFHDSKTFSDLQYDESADAILDDYRAHKNDPGFDLKAFVCQSVGTIRFSCGRTCAIRLIGLALASNVKGF